LEIADDILKGKRIYEQTEKQIKYTSSANLSTTTQVWNGITAPRFCNLSCL